MEYATTVVGKFGVYESILESCLYRYEVLSLFQHQNQPTLFTRVHHRVIVMKIAINHIDSLTCGCLLLILGLWNGCCS